MDNSRHQMNQSDSLYAQNFDIGQVKAISRRIAQIKSNVERSSAKENAEIVVCRDNLPHIR